MNRDLPSLLTPAALATLERLAASAPPGDFVEVGVYQGGSAQRLYRVARANDGSRPGSQRPFTVRALWLFDTFTGTPEQSAVDWVKTGAYDAGGGATVRALEAAMPGAHLVVGPFPETLADGDDPGTRIFNKQLKAFVHVDCDQYKTIRAAFRIFWEQLVPGGIILFDDYRDLPGARLAIHEMAVLLKICSWKDIPTTPEGKAYFVKPGTYPWPAVPHADDDTVRTEQP